MENVVPFKWVEDTTGVRFQGGYGVLNACGVGKRRIAAVVTGAAGFESCPIFFGVSVTRPDT